MATSTDNQRFVDEITTEIIGPGVDRESPRCARSDAARYSHGYGSAVGGGVAGMSARPLNKLRRKDPI